MDKTILLDKLEQLETLAKGSKIKRLLYAPWRYISGIFYTKIIYNITKKGKVKKIQTFFGDEMEVVIPAGMDIYLLGLKTHSSERRLVKFLIKNLEEGNTFVDIGAHFGFFSKLASKLVGENGKVYSIEASEYIFSTLKKNTSNNANIEAYHLAAGNKTGQIDFFEFPVLYSEYNTLYPKQFEKSNWFKSAKPKRTVVNTMSLDALEKKQNFNPDIIKIDVEGAEYDVIRGMENLLTTSAPIVIMEYQLGQRAIESHEKAIDLARQKGYSPYLINDDGSLLEIDNLSEIQNKKGLESDNIVLKK